MTKKLIVAAALAASLAAPAAHACSSGFLADLACRAGLIDKKTANGLDRVNDGLKDVIPGWPQQ